ncbi:hypothetical protein V8C42DRAFT_329625 [Trichoderma barbatum]
MTPETHSPGALCLPAKRILPRLLSCNSPMHTIEISAHARITLPCLALHAPLLPPFGPL